MQRIYIIRHGQDEDNAASILNGRRDKPLTRLGKAQAQDIANKIKESSILIDKVYSSPLIRAHDTAKAITDRLEMSEPEILPNLIERDFGVMTGQPISKVVECAPEILRTDTITYFLNAQGCETFPDLITRAKILLSELMGKNADGNVLLVTHGDIGKMIYASYYDLDWMDVLRMFHFGNSDMIELSEESAFDSVHVFKAEQFNL